MPDGTSRFSYQGKPIFHYIGLLDVLEFHRAAGNRGGEDPRGRAVRQELLYRLRRDDGVGAVVNTAKVTPGSNVVVFGLGGIGLNVIQSARMVGADKIIGVDLNDSKEDWGRRFGMTHFVNPSKVGGDVSSIWSD